MMRRLPNFSRLFAPEVWLVAAVLALSGCATPAAQDNTARLIARPDFPTAAQTAPEWVRDALRTVTQLEEQISRANAK